MMNWFKRKQPQKSQQQNLPAGWAQIMSELDTLRDRRIYSPRRIYLFQKALEGLPREVNPELWANLQFGLAMSYFQLPGENKEKNTKQALPHFQQALEVFTRQTSAAGWAEIQGMLAMAYMGLSNQGDRAENTEEAIHHYKLALEVFSRQAHSTR